MYLLEKAIMFARNNTLMRAHRWSPGVIPFAKVTHAPRSIGVEMSNSVHVHIGDQLFLAPVLDACRARGIRVVVAPTPSMRGYFQDAGYEVVGSDEVLAQELRIAPVWMYDWISRHERRERFVYLNTTDHTIASPISDHLARAVLRFLHVPGADTLTDCRPHRVAAGPTMLDGLDGPIALYSDAVDSGGFRITPEHRRRLEAFGASMQREGTRIVWVGSDADRRAKPAPLPFEHVDVRGQTSVVDLFRMLASPSVVATVSFDTAVAHIGMLYGKPAYICMRRFSPAHERFVKRYVIPHYHIDPPPVIHYLEGDSA